MEELLQEVHLDTPSREDERRIPFEFLWPEGDYLIEVRPILLRKDWKERTIAQSEPQTLIDQPLRVKGPCPNLCYSVGWPSMPLEELDSHGVIHPDGRTERG